MPEEWAHVVECTRPMLSNNAGPIKRMYLHAAELARDVGRAGLAAKMEAVCEDPKFRANSGGPMKRTVLALYEAEIQKPDYGRLNADGR